MATKILRLPDVIALSGLSRSTIYLRIAQGRFPRQVSLGGGDSRGAAVGWVASEVEECLKGFAQSGPKQSR